MMQNDRFVVIRSPDSQGAIVAKFDGGSREAVKIPDAIADYDGFIVQSVSTRSALNDKAIDQSGLSDSDIERLKASGFPDLR